jgi:hypothetical protein
MPRKKSKSKKEEKIKITNLDGWTLGDYAWANYVDGSIVEGEVIDFYPKDNHGPCASILTVNRGQRTVLIKDMRDKKIKKTRNKKI